MTKPQLQGNSTRATGLDRPLLVSCQQFNGKFDFTQIDLLCEAAVLHTCATANFATVQGGKHRQHIIELFATTGILTKKKFILKMYI